MRDSGRAMMRALFWRCTPSINADHGRTHRISSESARRPNLWLRRLRRNGPRLRISRFQHLARRRQGGEGGTRPAGDRVRVPATVRQGRGTAPPTARFVACRDSCEGVCNADGRRAWNRHRTARRPKRRNLHLAADPTTARTMLPQDANLRLLVWCTACRRHQAPADLQAIVAAGRGRHAAERSKFRCRDALSVQPKYRRFVR